MAKAESSRRKLIELIFFLAVLGCLVLALVEIGSNLTAEWESQREAASPPLPDPPQ